MTKRIVIIGAVRQALRGGDAEMRCLFAPALAWLSRRALQIVSAMIQGQRFLEESLRHEVIGGDRLLEQSPVRCASCHARRFRIYGHRMSAGYQQANGNGAGSHGSSYRFHGYLLRIEGGGRRIRFFPMPVSEESSLFVCT